MAEIKGTDNDDALTGTGGADTITGNGGNDTISGGSGADTIFGDVVDPFETPSGSSFNDSIDGDGGADVIDGGAGNDTIDGSGGADTILASVGDDTIDGGNGTDTYDASGDIAETFPVYDPPDPFPQQVTITDSSKRDFTDDSGVATDQAGQVTYTGVIGTNYGTINFTGIGNDGAGDEDVIQFDLSTFADNFNIVLSSGKKAPGPEDEIQFIGATNIVDNGGNNWTISYENGGNNYTINLSNTNGAAVTDGDGGTGGGNTLDEGDIIEQLDVTVGTTGINNDNIANYGDGTADKEFFDGSPDNDGVGTDTFSNIEHFVANEVVIPANPASGTIPIDNPSFETPGNLGGGGYTTGDVPGWTLSGAGGVYHADNTVAGETGDNVYYSESNSSILSQTLDKKYNADETYTFTMDIGDGTSGTQSYDLRIYAGNTQIGQTTGSTTNAMSQVTVTSGPGNTALDGENLRIEIRDTGGSGEMYVDNVQGSFVNSNPTPAIEVEDTIHLTGTVLNTDVTISNSAIGIFTDANTGTVTAFGGSGQPTINDLLNSGAKGSFEITDGAEDGEVGGISFENFENISFDCICFAGGTMIKTDHGDVLVEDLKVGDKVLTMDCGYQKIRWIGGHKLSAVDLKRYPKLKPVRIHAGALGLGTPKRDLLVSRQHRVLIKSTIAERIFGSSEVLIPAIKLTEMPGIMVDEDTAEVEFYHILFDDHQIIFSNGAATESLFTGPESLKAIPKESVEEIAMLFPHIMDKNFAPKLVRPVPPTGKLLKKLTTRHLKNSKRLFSTTL